MGNPLRLYAAPHGEVDHPWTLAADVAAGARMDGDQVEEWLSKMRQYLPAFVGELPDSKPILAELVVTALFRAWLDAGYEHAQALLDWQRMVQQVALRNFIQVPGEAVQ